MKVKQSLLALVEVGHEKLEVSSLAEHPEIGGESEVGGDDMENPAPDTIAGPNITVIDDKVIPEKPGDTTQCQRDEEILVDGDSSTRKVLECKEDDKGHKKEAE